MSYYNFVGIPNFYGFPIRDGRDFMVPLELFQSMFNVFPMEIYSLGNDVFIEIDSSRLRSVPQIVPRMLPQEQTFSRGFINFDFTATTLDGWLAPWLERR